MILAFYADMKPHPLYEQFYWIKNLDRKLNPNDFIKITRKLFIGGMITFFGDDYFEQKIQNRRHILTEFGDKVYRDVAMNRDGDEKDFVFFKREEKLKKSKGEKKWNRK
jgi:hypothetical protein